MYRTTLRCMAFAAATCLWAAGVAAGTRSVETIEVAGQSRTYCTFTPTDIAAPVRVVFHFHGSFARRCNDTIIGNAWETKAEAEGFVLVLPLGSVGWVRSGEEMYGWNACSAPPETCPADSARNDAERRNDDDVGFFVALWDRVVAEYGAERIYLSGHSNGGGMVYNLICHVPELIDAAAVMGATNVAQSCAGLPVPFLHAHGAEDPLIPWPLGYLTQPSPLLMFAERAEMNGGDATSRLVVIADCEHGWPGAPVTTEGVRCSNAFRLEDLLWDFYEAQ